jgi:mannose/fructose/N-acetylgalactosamine-specific phosphotransferase system component IIB
VDLPLLRVDDRLLHGQVLVGWAGALQPARVLLASDGVAADAVRRRIYEDLPHEDFELGVVTLEAAARALAAGGRVLVVCGSPADARRLVELGAGIERLNLGNLRGPDRRALTQSVFLTRQDVVDLQAILARGVRVEARDLPGTRGVAVDAARLAPLWE